MTAAREAVGRAAVGDVFADLVIGAVARVGAEILDSSMPATKIQEYISSAEKSCSLLVEQLRRLQQLEAKQLAPWTSEWWGMEHQHLQEALVRDALTGADQWLRLFAEALLSGHTDGCEGLLTESFALPPQASDTHAVLREGTRALREGRHLDVLPMLAQLGQASTFAGGEPLLSPNDRALLHIFFGHILLYAADDPDAALRLFQLASDLAPQDGRPHAAMGDYSRARALTGSEGGKRNKSKATLLAEAKTQYEAARDLTPDQPEGFIGLGLLSEEEGLWRVADHLYEAATLAFEPDLHVADTAAVVGRRLGPTSGNLLLQVARGIADHNPSGALDAVERALVQTVRGEGEYPERLGYRVQAELQETLERYQESAQSYFEAGKRYSWRREYAVASELLAKSSQLDPEHAPTYWYLADTLAAQGTLPEPPFVSEKQMQAGEALWESGAARALPEGDHAWAYLSRAFMSAQLGRLPDESQQERLWQAVAYTERALVHGPNVAQNWDFLSDYYHQLGLQINEYEAARSAIALQPGSADTLEAIISSLANAGAFDRARSWLRKYERRHQQSSKDTKDQPTGAVIGLAWREAVEAFMLSREGEGQYQRARERLDAAFALLSSGSAPEADYPLWYHQERALCLRLLGEWLLAEQDLQAIWSRYHPQDRDNQESFGWAAYNLGKLDDAIRIFGKLRRDLPDIGGAQRNLGLCLIAFGELRAGEEELTDGIAKASNKLQLEDLLRFEFPELEKLIPIRADGEKLRQSLARLKERIAARRAKVKRRPSPSRELEAVLAVLNARGQKSGPAWVGCHAGLARLHVKKKRWLEAGRAYRMLYEAGSDFPDVGAALDAALSRVETEGDSRLHEGSPGAALEAYRDAQTLLSESGVASPARAAAIESRLSISLAKTDPVASRNHLTRALQLFREAGEHEPGDAIAKICRPLLHGVGDFWAVDASWEAFTSEIDPEERAMVAAARDALLRFLDDHLRLSESEGELYDDRPALEIASGLVPSNTGPEWSLFQSYLPEMRARVQAEMGTLLPGILVRGSNSDAPNSYSVLLDKYPILAEATVPLDRGFSRTPAEVLQAHGARANDLLPTTDPLSGALASWVGPEAWGLLNADGFEWFEPLYYVVLHFEAVLRHHLHELFGLEELQELLTPIRSSESGVGLIAAVAPDIPSKVRLSRVLRALLWEQVPITPLEVALDAVREAGRSGDLDEAVRAVRLRLRDRLPGTAEDVTWVELPPDLEATIERLLIRKGNQPMNTAELQEIHALLGTIGDLVVSTERAAVLTTRSSKVRPYLRRLIEQDFPSLMVLAQEETIPQGAAPNV